MKYTFDSYPFDGELYEKLADWLLTKGTKYARFGVRPELTPDGVAITGLAILTPQDKSDLIRAVDGVFFMAWARWRYQLQNVIAACVGAQALPE